MVMWEKAAIATVSYKPGICLGDGERKKRRPARITSVLTKIKPVRKSKVVPVHPMKEYRRSRGTAPLI
jgi:hypothetical protein